MTEDKATPLRERMMADMRIRGIGDKAQKSHIRAIKEFTNFVKRSPDTATADDLRAYQLQTAVTAVTPSTFNTRCRSAVFLQHDLGTRGNEEFHAIQAATEETAYRVQCRRSF